MSAICIACAQSKHLNCAGQAVDLDTDNFVTCRCATCAQARAMSPLTDVAEEYNAAACDEVKAAEPDFEDDDRPDRSHA